MSRSQEKIERIRKALLHKEPDRIPKSDFFWNGFVRKCKEKWGDDFNPYYHWDLDYVVVTPNMDPHIIPFEITKEGLDEIVKTGFEATIRRRGDIPMPHYEDFSIKKPEMMAQFKFDDPSDKKRFFQGGDDQLNCVGDTLRRNIAPWIERLESYVDNFALFGSVCDPYEYLWRIIGSENSLLWMGIEPDLLKAFIDRIGDFLFKFLEAQMNAGKGHLSGMYIWGDVAYRNGMLFGADRWRQMFKEHVKKMIELCHSNGLLVIYHGCGNASDIFDDMVEIGLDGYNPLEAKADLNVVKLKKKYADKLAFVGNIDIGILERGFFKEIEREIRYKLQAAKGGGWICQSDHSVSNAVAPESYDIVIKTLQKYGNYPLDL